MFICLFNFVGHKNACIRSLIEQTKISNEFVAKHVPHGCPSYDNDFIE